MSRKKSAAWSDLIEEFRRLGGTAENICMRSGARGRGLFAIDPSMPVQVRAPSNLLLPVEHAGFEDGGFIVLSSAKIGNAEKAWIERYMNEFSWGRGGREEAEATVKGMRSLPMPVREKLAQHFSLDFCLGEVTPGLVEKRFLASRVITHEQRTVVMPMIELVNHGPAAGYDSKDGIAVQGHFTDEVLVNYGAEQDTFGLFASWGIVCERPFAYSLPMVLRARWGELAIHQNREDGRVVDISLPNPLPMKLPNLTVEGERLHLSFLVLGLKGMPRVPKGVFRRVFREAGRVSDDEPFEMAQHLSRAAFLDLLKDLEDAQGPTASALRSVCLMQLATLNQCFGSRSI